MRTRIYTKQPIGIKHTPNNMFNIIIPGFLTNQSIDFDVHYCIESPQFEKEDWYQPHIAEMKTVHVQQTLNQECFVTAGAAIICRDDYPIVEIEQQCIEFPQLFFVENHMNDVIAFEVRKKLFPNQFKE